jgi:CRP-like cAMP-binding protein
MMQYKRYKKSEIIFEIDHLATHYYQIISGAVKMNNYNDGSLFRYFYAESEFGEPSLFLDRTYPANAEAVEILDCSASQKQFPEINQCPCGFY